MLLKKHLFHIFCGITIILSCFTSCKNKPATIVYPDGITIIEVNNIDDNMNVEDILDPETAQMIVLETTEESMISNIYEISYFEGKYYIVDLNRTTVFIFDQNGKYLRKINNVGKGPNEYLQITRFTVDPVSRKVLLSDPGLGKIFVCDLDLNIEKIVRTDPIPSFIAAYRNGYFLQGQPYPHLKNSTSEIYKESDATLIDSTGRIVKSLIPTDRDDENSFYPAARPVAYERNGSILMISGFSDIIYEVSPSLDSVKPKYLLDFKMKNRKLVNYNNYDKLIENKHLASLTLNNMVSNEGYVYTGECIYNTDTHLFVGYGNKIYCIYDKINKKSLCYNMESQGSVGVKGDKSMLMASNYLCGSAGERMLFSIPAMIWKINVEPEKAILLRHISDSIHKLDDNSNPVIISFKIKEFK